MLHTCIKSPAVPLPEKITLALRYRTEENMEDFPVVFDTQCVSSCSVSERILHNAHYLKVESRLQNHSITHYDARFSAYLKPTLL